MKTLCQGRRRIAASQFDLARQTMPDAELLLISEERLPGKDVRWWMEYSRSAEPVVPLDAETRTDVVSRCRFLRQHTEEKQDELIEEALGRWRDILEAEKIERVLTLPMDSYVIHCLKIAADRLGLPCYHAALTAFNGKMRFSNFGEYVGRVRPEYQESPEEYYDKITGSEVKPEWLMGTDTAPANVARRRWMIDMLKPPGNFLYRHLTGDHDSFSFANREKHLPLMFATRERVKAALECEEAAKQDLPDDFIFLPMQFYPESTSDYHIRSLKLNNHHKNVLATVEELRKIMPVVIKEHPAVFGRRSARVLRELMAMENVQFLRLGTSLSGVLARATMILGQGSTTTFQSQVMGKPVMFFGEPFFGTINGSRPLESLERPHIRETAEAVLGYSETPDKAEILKMIDGYLNTCGDARLGGFTPLLEKTALHKQGPYAGESFRQLWRDITEG